ncbi:MAG: RNA polymerase sigma factor [Deltaproteobacteria bacterium]|nr:RNA polymerase sigma factor [Deltaproteobacteria bacterium]MBN2671900.1 RNA polymerase sigma factor [Deltaproteobacteria bacterium]
MKKPGAEQFFSEEYNGLDVLALYDAYHRKIFRYALNRTGDVEVARDIAADVFFKVHKHRWKFVFSGAPVSAWLYKIAGNEIVSFQRKQKYRPVALDNALSDNDIVPMSLRGDLQEEIQDAQEHVHRHAAFLRIQKQISRLPGKYQEVIVLRYLEEKSVQEISELLGKKEGTVKSLLSRGISKLKKASYSGQLSFAPAGMLVETGAKEGARLS